MKKFLILGLVAVAFVFTSCNKENATEDVDKAIKKLEYYNETFADFYSDGVIDTVQVDKKTKSEAERLKKIATEYYEMINKINSNVKDEREDVEKGKKSKGYEDAYKAALEAKAEEMNAAYELFAKNVAIAMPTEEVTEEVVEETATEETEEGMEEEGTEETSEETEEEAVEVE